MSVHYKFKSNLDYDTVTFDGLHISVADLKKSIMQQKKIGKSSDFDLQITNAQTKEVYDNEEILVPKNTSVVVARVPVTTGNKKSWERSDLPLPLDDSESSSQIHFDKLVKNADLANSNVSEEDKVKAMISQSSQEYDPSKYVKSRSMTGPLPPTYTCYRCGKQGHWIKNCPTNNLDIKRSTGIPRSFMVPVDGPDHKGALLTSSGDYAVPIIDHQAYKEVKKEKPPFVKESEPESEPEPQIPEELLCMVCRDLLQDAVLIPCCGNSFCDECVRQVLLESDNHECPLCHEIDISPDTVIPNRFLRTAVLNFKNETGYTRIKKIIQISSTHPVHVESPQPSPDSTVENHPVQPLPNSSDDVIYETPCPSSSNQDNPNVFEEVISGPAEQETSIEQSIEVSNEDVQPGTPLADEPPVDILPQTMANESSHERTGDRHSYDREPVYSEYPAEIDPVSREDGKISSSEHQTINPIITIGRNWHHQPPSSWQKFPQKKPHHHGSIGQSIESVSTSATRRGHASHQSHRSKTNQDWSKNSLTVLVERRDNYDLRDRLGSHERFDRRNRDERLPSRPVQRPLKTCARYNREPREPRYRRSENRHDFHDYSAEHEQAQTSMNYDVQPHVEESVHGHQQRYTSPPPVLPQHRLGGPPPYSTQAAPRQLGPFHSTPQPFPPQPPPPGSSPVSHSTSAAQPPPPGVGPLLPTPPPIIHDPPSSAYVHVPQSFEPEDNQQDVQKTKERCIGDRLDEFARELLEYRRDHKNRSRSRSHDRDRSHSSSRSHSYSSSKSWSRSVSRTSSRSTRSRSHSSYSSRSHSRSYSHSRSRSRSKTRSYTRSRTRSRSKSRSRTRSKSRSRSRDRRRADSHERIRTPVQHNRAHSLSPKVYRPRNHRSPFQIKRDYNPPHYGTSYQGQYAPAPTPHPHPMIRPHLHPPSHIHSLHPVQQAPHPHTLDHYAIERPRYTAYNEQYSGYDMYRRGSFNTQRYDTRNNRFDKQPQEYQRRGEEVHSRVTGWDVDRRRNFKPGFRGQREQYQRKKIPNLSEVEIKPIYIKECNKEELPTKKRDDRYFNKHKKHDHHHRNRETKKQDGHESKIPVLGSKVRTGNILKVEVLPDIAIESKKLIEIPKPEKPKEKKHKHKKKKEVEQTGKKKAKTSRKEKSSVMASSESDSTTKVKTKKKKVKQKTTVEESEGKKSQEKVSTKHLSSIAEREKTQNILQTKNCEENLENLTISNKAEHKQENNIQIILSAEQHIEDENMFAEDAECSVNEQADIKEPANSECEVQNDIGESHTAEMQDEDPCETTENPEDTSFHSADDGNIEEAESDVLHVELPAISKWETEEYEEELIKPLRKNAILPQKEEKESLSSDIIQRAEKAILQKALKTAIVNTPPNREKHIHKNERRNVIGKQENTVDTKENSPVGKRASPKYKEQSEIKSTCIINADHLDSPTLQVTISTDKEKRSVHTKKKSDAKENPKEDSTQSRRLKLDRSKFTGKLGETSNVQNVQRTVIIAEADVPSEAFSFKHDDKRKNVDYERDLAKRDKVKKHSLESTDLGQNIIREKKETLSKTSDSTREKESYYHEESLYIKDDKRKKCNSSERYSRVSKDNSDSNTPHAIERSERCKRFKHDFNDQGKERRYPETKTRQRAIEKPKRESESKRSRSKSHDSTDSYHSATKKQYIRKYKRHSKDCINSQMVSERSDDSGQRKKINKEKLSNTKNESYDKTQEKVKKDTDISYSAKPIRRKDLTQDESKFEPNYDETSDSDHSVSTELTESKQKYQETSNKRSSDMPESSRKRIKHDRQDKSVITKQSSSASSVVDSSKEKIKTDKSSITSSPSSSAHSGTESSDAENPKKTVKSRSPDSDHKHKHKKSRHKKHKKHKHKHKKKKSHRSKQKD